MAKGERIARFWAKFRWVLYGLQCFFTLIGLIVVVNWMRVPENRQNALIGAIIVLGIVLVGAIAILRTKAKTAVAARKQKKAEKLAEKGAAKAPAIAANESAALDSDAEAFRLTLDDGGAPPTVEDEAARERELAELERELAGND